MRRQTVLRLAAVWTVLLVIGCFIPGSTIPEWELPEGELDKLAHFALFFGFALFWTLAKPRRWLLIGITGVVLGGAIEIIQPHLPWPRSAEWGDFVADVLGVVAGLALGRWLIRRFWPEQLFEKRGVSSSESPPHETGAPNTHKINPRSMRLPASESAR
ncbi:hypothetical protein BH23BAC4_BH23BAC4_06650 [soil metagenome]